MSEAMEGSEMRSAVFFTTKRGVSLTAGVVLIALGLILRFTMHDARILPVACVAAGAWLVLKVLKQALTRSSPDDIYRRAAA